MDKESVEQIVHDMNIEAGETRYEVKRSGKGWTYKEIQGKPNLQEPIKQETVAPIMTQADLEQIIRDEVEAKQKLQASRESPEAMKKKARADFEKAEERKRIEKELQQEKAATGYVTKSARDADAYFYSIQRQGYMPKMERTADGNYKVVAIDKSSGKPVFIEPEGVAKEQIESRKKQSEEGFFGKARMRRNVSGFVKNELQTVIPGTVKKEIGSTLKVTGEHGDIVGSQIKQVKGITIGQHPMIYGYEEGKKPRIMSEVGVSEASTLHSGNEPVRKRTIAKLPTTKLDFSEGG